MSTTNKISRSGYNCFLLFVAGLGGLLYGVDVGIIAGALPYLEATFKDAATGQTLNAEQLSVLVAAVLLGSVISTLVAGLLADWLAGLMKCFSWTSRPRASVSRYCPPPSRRTVARTSPPTA